MMNANLKAAWIAAMQSGEFQHVRGALERSRRGQVKACCCFGVLANILVERGLMEREDFNSDGLMVFTDASSIFRYTTYIPGDITKKYGIDINAVKILVGINDKQSTHSYAKQIKYISENL